MDEENPPDDVTYGLMTFSCLLCKLLGTEGISFAVANRDISPWKNMM